MRRHLAAGGAIVAATHLALPVAPDVTLELAAHGGRDAGGGEAGDGEAGP